MDLETFFREWPLRILRRVARGGIFGAVFGAITSVNDQITDVLEWRCYEERVLAHDLKAEVHARSLEKVDKQTAS